MKNKFIHYGIVLLAIAGISAGLLGFVNQKTAPVIAANALEKENEAKKIVLPGAIEFKNEEVIVKDDLNFVPGYNENNELLGYVVNITQGGGFNGNIKFLLGISKDGEVQGLNVLEHGETAGLGAKITEKSWQDNWIGRNKDYQFDKSVDGFTGATISPKAVYTGVIRALDAFEEVVK